MKTLSILVTLTAIALYSSSAAMAQSDDKKSIKPCVTITGDNSKVAKSSFHCVRSLEDWAKIWAKHTGQEDVPYKNWDNEYDVFYNRLNLPLVDFDNYMVIGIFKGVGGNNAGLHVVAIDESDEQIRFRFQNKTYGTSGPNGGGKDVQAFGFFVVPASSKPIVIEEKVDRKGRGKTEWKQRFQFKSAK